jgi:predicted SAM-dependent methyltransferase
MKKLHFGPGGHWKNPDDSWIRLDRDKDRAEIVIDFKDFQALPLENGSVSCIYGAHVFEHMAIFVTPIVFRECHRVLCPGGFFRLVLPDVEKSIREYMAGNTNYPLFKLRRDRAKNSYGLDYTLFECLREDFLSVSKSYTVRELGHQNAWDFQSIQKDLMRAGFNQKNIHQMKFRQTNCPDLAFEGTYKATANDHARSLYVEAKK